MFRESNLFFAIFALVAVHISFIATFIPGEVVVMAVSVPVIAALTLINLNGRQFVLTLGVTTIALLTSIAATLFLGIDPTIVKVSAGFVVGAVSVLVTALAFRCTSDMFVGIDRYLPVKS